MHKRNCELSGENRLVALAAALVNTSSCSCWMSPTSQLNPFCAEELHPRSWSASAWPALSCLLPPASPRSSTCRCSHASTRSPMHSEQTGSSRQALLSSQLRAQPSIHRGRQLPVLEFSAVTLHPQSEQLVLNKCSRGRRAKFVRS